LDTSHSKLFAYFSVAYSVIKLLDELSSFDEYKEEAE